ncbi:MAG: hypothetical protein U9P80_05500 [Thermodesulfobacteriota bacterium]|nr:hypothetical protein [Thermodesulfobacteriota bacterium]
MEKTGTPPQTGVGKDSKPPRLSACNAQADTQTGESGGDGEAFPVSSLRPPVFRSPVSSLLPRQNAIRPGT